MQHICNQSNYDVTHCPQVWFFLFFVFCFCFFLGNWTHSFSTMFLMIHPLGGLDVTAKKTQEKETGGRPQRIVIWEEDDPFKQICKSRMGGRKTQIVFAFVFFIVLNLFSVSDCKRVVLIEYSISNCEMELKQKSHHFSYDDDL